MRSKALTPEMHAPSRPPGPPEADPARWRFGRDAEARPAVRSPRPFDVAACRAAWPTIREGSADAAPQAV